MGIFGLGKKKDVIDLGEIYRKRQEKAQSLREDMGIDIATPIPNNSGNSSNTNSSGGFFGGFFGGNANSSNTSTTASTQTYGDENSNTDVSEKRRKLIKRLMDMTAKIEDLGNQIYHLKQRIDVLEKKQGVGSY